ncbi:MAG: hypothetical protein MUE63_10175 [Xanthomonadales bacterium]|nr:hypothetical protein [Xanthomonadales bacterium]
MKKQFLLLLAGALTLMLYVPAGQAGTEPIAVNFAGSNYDTAVDNLDDGLPLSLSYTQAKGSFGAKQLDISAEFYPSDVDCQTGYSIEVGMLYSASVTTFADHSQIFGFSDSGWMCVHPTTGHYYGEVYGVYGGGTGRFEGASGEWVTTFEGYNLEPPGLEPVGFRTIVGTVNGTIALP